MRFVSLLLLMLAACSQTTVTAKAPDPPVPKPKPIQCRASYYGGGKHSGEHLSRFTSNGETFNPSRLTAAHRTLPFGTKVLVTNLTNGDTVTVRITDRGPAAWTGRDIDLSKGAAQHLEMIQSGVVRVSLEVMK